jgi:hypothetical protein
MTPLFSIATLFLSVAVVVIAWQQWRVADNKPVRSDLKRHFVILIPQSGEKNL